MAFVIDIRVLHMAMQMRSELLRACVRPVLPAA